MNQPETPELKTLLIATGIAALVAGVILVAAILPAEYGVDPTGIGGVLDLTALDAEPEGPEENRTPVQTLTEYEGQWPLTTTTLYEETLYIDPTGRTIPVRVDTPNLVSFTVIATWSDDNTTGTQGTSPDLLEATVTPPRKEAANPVLARSDSDGHGRLEASQAILPAPEPATVVAPSPDEAFFALQDLHPPNHGGTGEWILDLVLEPGQSRVQGIEIPGTDDGNNVHVRIDITTFALDTNLTATESRLLEKTFQLGPGAGMEFKVYMEAGQAFDYSWNTTAGELYYDFHGDPAGGDGSDFVRHDEGQGRAASGEFTAPFDGSHGWYWENQHFEPVTITLTLRGQFVLL